MKPVERAWWQWWLFAWQCIGFQVWKDDESCGGCRRMICVCVQPEPAVRP